MTRRPGGGRFRGFHAGRQCFLLLDHFLAELLWLVGQPFSVCVFINVEVRSPKKCVSAVCIVNEVLGNDFIIKKSFTWKTSWCWIIVWHFCRLLGRQEIFFGPISPQLHIIILKPCFPPNPEKAVVRQCPEKALLQVETKTLGSWKRLTRPKAVASNNVGGGFDATSAAPELALRRLSRAPALAPERAPAVGRSCDRRTLFNFF